MKIGPCIFLQAQSYALKPQERLSSIFFSAVFHVQC